MKDLDVSKDLEASNVSKEEELDVPKDVGRLKCI